MTEQECVITQKEVLGLTGFEGLSSEILELAYGVIAWELEKQLREKTNEVFKWTDHRARPMGFMSRDVEYYSVAIDGKIVDIKIGLSIIMRGNYAEACREAEKQIRQFFEQLSLDVILDHMRFRMLIHQERELDIWLAGRRAAELKMAKSKET